MPLEPGGERNRWMRVRRAFILGRTSAWPSIDWAGLIGLRNVLIHAYHRIQPDLLWQAATVDIPSIAAKLQG